MMFTVSDLVQEQRRFEKKTHLKESLGDGYLYAHNVLFRNLRKESLRLGVQFSARPGLFDYHACANLAFERILSKKTVPYLKNVKPLLKMQDLLPALHINKVLEIKKNNILHESAHLVSQAALKKIKNSNDPTERQRAFVLKALLSESYASSCETIGQYFSQNEIHHWMYRHNTNVYGCDHPEYKKLLSYLIQKVGIRTCFKLSVLSFLHWNFFYLSFNNDLLEEVLPLCDLEKRISSREKNLLLKFCNFHFRIHNWFRKEIAEFYFHTSGYKKPIAELLQFKFISYLSEDGPWQKGLDQLVDLAIERK